MTYLFYETIFINVGKVSQTTLFQSEFKVRCWFINLKIGAHYSIGNILLNTAIHNIGANFQLNIDNENWVKISLQDLF